MNIIIIPLIILTSILISSDKIPEDIKAYGTINFGDGKQYVNSKFKENEIRKDSDTNAKIIHLLDIPFEIEFIYGTNDMRPTFLKTIRLKLRSIIDSHIINKVIDSFDKKYGPSEKYYIDVYEDSKEYYRWEKDDKVVHLDFDGMNIEITINSKHFNSLSKSYIDKDIKESYKKKATRHKNQLKKLF